MIDDTEDNNVEKNKDKSGKGKVGSAGGLVGAGTGGIVFSLDASKLKEVMANWRKLDVGEAVMAVAEFFSELPARASANLQVKFDSATKAGFAIVNQTIRFGQDIAMAMRARTRESAVQIRKTYGIKLNFKVKRGGQTIVLPNPGMT